MKLGKLITDFELEVLRGVEHYEDVLIQREDVQALLGGKTVMKVIFVPGRLLNIVAK